MNRMSDQMFEISDFKTFEMLQKTVERNIKIIRKLCLIKVKKCVLLLWNSKQESVSYIRENPIQAAAKKFDVERREEVEMTSERGKDCGGKAQHLGSKLKRLKGAGRPLDWSCINRRRY